MSYVSTYSRISSTASSYFIPSSIRAKATKTGARPNPATQWTATQEEGSEPNLINGQNVIYLSNTSTVWLKFAKIPLTKEVEPMIDDVRRWKSAVVEYQIGDFDAFLAQLLDFVGRLADADNVHHIVFLQLLTKKKRIIERSFLQQKMRFKILRWNCRWFGRLDGRWWGTAFLCRRFRKEPVVLSFVSWRWSSLVCYTLQCSQCHTFASTANEGLLQSEKKKKRTLKVIFHFKWKR